MSHADESHADLILALGGKAKLARELCLHRNALSKWHVRGIPARYWHRVIGIAAALDPAVILTAADLERTKPWSEAPKTIYQ